MCVYMYIYNMYIYISIILQYGKHRYGVLLGTT